MASLDEILTKLKALEPELRRRYPIRALGVFGSHVRGEARADSDLDVLVESGDGMTLPDLAGLQIDLSAALGVRVDIADKAALRAAAAPRILAEVRMTR
jgi:uncharacterized protein